MSWTHKYRPVKISDIQGQDSALEKLKACVDKIKPALLYGPPGCGKTASAYALANEGNYELIEVNASDFRDKASLNARLGPAIQQYSLFGNSKIILVDEVDGISGRYDRGAVAALVTLIEKSKFPVILTANDPYDPKLSKLRSRSEVIQFKTPAYTSVRAVLKKVCKAESITVEEDVLTKLAMAAGGDIRGAITDLQTLSDSEITKEDVETLSARNQTDTMITAMMKILKTTNPMVAKSAYDTVDENLDEIFLWIDENMPQEYTKPGDLFRGYNCISKADIFRRRIMRWQYWRYMVYIYDLLSAGVALAKEEKYSGFNKYKRSGRILKIWHANKRTATAKAIAAKWAEAAHFSQKHAFRDIELLKKMYKANPDTLTEELDLETDEIAWLKK